MLAQQRVLEGNVDAAVGILDVEDHGVAADFAPVADDAESVIAGGHDAGQVDGADFEISRNGNSLFGDRSGEDSGDDDIFVGLEEVGGAVAVTVADSVGEFGGRQVRSAAEISSSNSLNGFAALGGVYFRAGGSDGNGFGRNWNGCADGMKLRGCRGGGVDGLGFRSKVRGRVRADLPRGSGE